MGRTASHIVRENEVLRIELPDALPEGWIAIAENDEATSSCSRPMTTSSGPGTTRAGR